MGGFVYEDLLDNIDAGECALLVRRIVYEALKIYIILLPWALAFSY